MKRISALLLALAISGQAAEEKKSALFDCESWAEGEVPKEVFIVDGTIKIAGLDGNKTLMIAAEPITDATAQLGDSSKGSSSIEARVFASKRGRSTPRMGLSVHGMNGYRLWLNAAKKQLELVFGGEVVTTAPFSWVSDTWTKLRLDVTQVGEKECSITAKAWQADGVEPKEPQIKISNPAVKGQGKCAIWGSPFSEKPIYFDDIKVVTTPAPAE